VPRSVAELIILIAILMSRGEQVAGMEKKTFKQRTDCAHTGMRGEIDHLDIQSRSGTPGRHIYGG
jgi:hypothetical protein